MAEKISMKMDETTAGVEMEEMTGQRETAREAAMTHLYELREENAGEKAYATWRMRLAYQNRLKSLARDRGATGGFVE